MNNQSTSALEGAVHDLRGSFRRWATRHDRFVVVGAILAAVPLPPACFLGLVVGLLNAMLLRAGRLGPSERKTIIASVVLGALNSVIAVVAISFFADRIMQGDLSMLPAPVEMLFELISNLLDRLTGHAPGSVKELEIPV